MVVGTVKTDGQEGFKVPESMGNVARSKDVQAYIDEVTSIMRQIGVSEDTIYAFNKTERIVTGVNAHLLTPEDIQEWNDAVAEYHRSQVQ